MLQHRPENRIHSQEQTHRHRNQETCASSMNAPDPPPSRCP